MATIAQNIPVWSRPLTGFREFLQDELAPYPGRGALVARMIIASTVVMILTMTFQIPFGAYGAIYALSISRESPEETLSAVRTIIIAFAISAVYVLIGALLFQGDPLPRFLWVIASLFLVFYLLRAMTSYSAASRFGYLIVITIPLWDRHVSTEVQVEDTLWAVGAITLASVVTAAIEVIAARLKPWNDLVQSLAERLACVEEALNGSNGDGFGNEKTRKEIARQSTLGTSRLRRILQRASYSPHYAEQMGAMVALTGRLVDLAANLTYLEIHPTGDDRQRIRSVAENIASIRADLLSGRSPHLIARDSEDAVSGIPLLREMQRTVGLISEALVGTQSLSAYAPSPMSADPPWRLFAPDAFSNSDHIKFGLRGCFAASLCYFIYNAVAWPGISTAVTTCLLTALTTVGSSRQKQILRFAGALVGGVIMGLGAQIFILPALDTIAGFTVLFVAVIAVAAWIASSGPRLSYFGVQIAVAFCLINLQEFKPQTSLAVARDRVAGIFLGLIVMWVVFDQIWGAPAAMEMKKTLISALRLLAEFAREPSSKDLKVAIERSYSLRERINKSFDTVRALADGVLLEFGPSRQRDMALRSQIVQWQPQLRMVFVTRIALLKYRLNLPGFELPEKLRLAQQEFDERLAQMLDGMADRMEAKPPRGDENLEAPFDRLKKATQSSWLEGPGEMSAGQMQTFLLLSRRIESLIITLDKEIE